MLRTVSTIIPTFNRPEATIRAVDSALAQTRPPDEIIVVDDASDPPFQLNSSNLRDPRIRIVRLQSNSGASAARQAGVEAAKGDIVAFLDSDDQWLPHKLASQLDLLAKNEGNLVAVSCGWKEEGSRSKQRIPAASSDPADFASGCWFAPGSTVLVSRAAFSMVGPFDPSLQRLEDLDWFLRFALCGGRLEVAPVIGAAISIGRRGRSVPVEQASTQILRHFSSKLEPDLQRRLQAYLLLERATAARNDKHYGLMAVHLARSFLTYPRPQLPLKRWWRYQNI